MEFHWFHDKWISDLSQMKISAFDLSILRGFGVFDFLRTYNRKPFLGVEHVDRLIRSCDLVNLKLPYSKERILEIIDEGIKRSPYNDLYIKLILTGGESLDGITPQPGKQIFYVTFQKAKTYPDHMFTEGTSLMTYAFQRYIPEAKSLNYFAAVVSLGKASQDLKATEVLYVDPANGNLLEGTTVNFWAVMNGKIYTASDNVLYGITRGFVLNLCKQEGLQVVTNSIPCHWIPKLDEAFITSTTKEVMPITTIDGKPVGDGKVGPLTKKVMNAFTKHIKENFGTPSKY